MHIEGPAVVAGEPVHVRRVGNDKHIDPGLFHRITGLGQALGIFRTRKVQRHTHAASPISLLFSIVWPLSAATARLTARLAIAVSCTPVPVRSAKVMPSALTRPF